MRSLVTCCANLSLLCSVILSLAGCAATPPPPVYVPPVSMPSQPPLGSLAHAPISSNDKFTKEYLGCVKSRNHSCIYELMSTNYQKKNNIDLCAELKHPDGEPIAFIEAVAIYNDRGLYRIVFSSINDCVADGEILQACSDIDSIANESWHTLVSFFNCYSMQKRSDCLSIIPMRLNHKSILSKYFASPEER